MRYLKLICVFMVIFALSNSAYSGWFGVDEKIIEKAWACGATSVVDCFNPDGQWSCNISSRLEPSDIFKFPKCNDLSEEDRNEFGAELMRKYCQLTQRGCDLHTFYTEWLAKQQKERAARISTLLETWHKSHPNEDALEKAWQCDPTTADGIKYERDYLNGDYQNFSYIKPGSDLTEVFQFRQCPSLSAEEKEVWSGVLFDQYADAKYFGTALYALNSEASYLRRFDEEKTRRENIRKKLTAAKAAQERAAIERAAIERADKEKAAALVAEALRAKEAEVALHQQQLKAGLIRPKNMKDVWLLYKTADRYEIKNLHSVMTGALLKPDNAIYGAMVTIDSEERSGVWLTKFAPGYAMTNPLIEDAAVTENIMRDLFATAFSGQNALSAHLNAAHYYAQLNLSRTTIEFAQNLQLGSGVWVVGRYTGNRKYRMTNGAVGTMPVLDVLYVGQ
jgi:hypothetical protein